MFLHVTESINSNLSTSANVDIPDHKKLKVDDDPVPSFALADVSRRFIKEVKAYWAMHFAVRALLLKLAHDFYLPHQHSLTLGQ